ncbi:cysteine desulfurase / selenocysteine lyase [Tistlia consotensis]|uniref:Cysteine desulfurase n=1 Tax=Tistlia consotensis USBA 355 TaxID=560819 RepID=A0A1Y6CY74_9PROT|nr:cysteine desulfurase [Tistlia consotensis]SMF82606.1 cysteine desulfurase / selenocysteine lyase [Tistlia consotensis USBA 355]SNS29636.1 cysteine desulfurase / selenocysteine lyase [Tistlia consotensis]
MSTAEALDQPYDVEAVRADFPILHRPVYGKPLVFLDSAASAQKPRQVIEAVSRLYETEYANVHRGLYYLSDRATTAFEAAREKVRGFLGAASEREIVFTRNGTEAINLVAGSWGRQTLKAGDEILVTELEHHANIVPWQLLCQATGALLKVARIEDDGRLDMASFERQLSERTKLVAVAHMSNVLGTILPVAEIVAKAKAVGATTLIDGCQGAVHGKVDVRALGCDFYVITGHKLYGPTGIGALYGREALLEAMPPYQGGGEMIDVVTFEGSTWAELPHKFEAGTPAIAQAVGLGAAIDYLQRLGVERVAAHEHALLNHATQRLAAIDGLRIVGTAPGKGGVISLHADFAHANDIGLILDREGVAVRTGNHCAQPLMARLGLTATARASLACYNRHEDVEALATALEKVKAKLG